MKLKPCPDDLCMFQRLFWKLISYNLHEVTASNRGVNPQCAAMKNTAPILSLKVSSVRGSRKNIKHTTRHIRKFCRTVPLHNTLLLDCWNVRIISWLYWVQNPDGHFPGSSTSGSRSLFVSYRSRRLMRTLPESGKKGMENVQPLC